MARGQAPGRGSQPDARRAAAAPGPARGDQLGSAVGGGVDEPRRQVERPEAVEASARIEIAFPGGPTVVAESQSSATRAGHAYAGRVTLDGQTLFDRAWSNA